MKLPKELEQAIAESIRIYRYISTEQAIEYSYKNCYRIMQEREAKLIHNINTAVKFMESQGYQNYAEHEPEYQMHKTLKELGIE